jgi:hypothetical protein
LLLCFDTLGGNLQFETSRKIGDGADNGVGFTLVRQSGNKALIDLDLMEWKTQQIAKR